MPWSQSKLWNVRMREHSFTLRQLTKRLSVQDCQSLQTPVLIWFTVVCFFGKNSPEKTCLFSLIKFDLHVALFRIPGSGQSRFMKSSHNSYDTLRITIHGHNAAPNDDCISPCLPRICFGFACASVYSIPPTAQVERICTETLDLHLKEHQFNEVGALREKEGLKGGCLGKDLLDKLTGPVNRISKNDSALDLGSIGRCIPIQTCESHKIELLLSHQIGNVALRRWSHIGSTRYVAWQALQAAPWDVCTWGRHYWLGAATSPNYPNLCFHGWWGSKIQWHFGGVVLNISANLAIVLRGRVSGVPCGKSPWASISHRAGCKDDGVSSTSNMLTKGIS